jgi:hypothetical protein
MQCKLKLKCPVRNNPPDLHNCWREDCDGMIHEPCSKLLLDRFSIPLEERPLVTDGTEDPIVFCTKTCYLKWLAEQKKKMKEAKKAAAAESETKKRKVPWEQDGSLSVLMEWITTEGNYSAYAGSNGNLKGKSKSQFHKEIALLIKSRVPDSMRDVKDVENKIVSLERQFRTATDWANNTGQGVENPGDFEAALLKRCPLYTELEPIMGERPNAKPLATNEESDTEEMDPLTLEEDTETLTTVEQSTSNVKTPLRVEGTPSTLSNSAGSSTTSKQKPNKRLTASASSVVTSKKKSKQDVNELVASLLGEEDKQEDFVSLRVREVTAKEKEAYAVAAKAEKETALLAIDETVKLLRKRKKLLEEGICDEKTIDLYLPMPQPKKQD